jgi:hypothetical protein
MAKMANEVGQAADGWHAEPDVRSLSDRYPVQSAAARPRGSFQQTDPVNVAVRDEQPAKLANTAVRVGHPQGENQAGTSVPDWGGTVVASQTGLAEGRHTQPKMGARGQECSCHLLDPSESLGNWIWPGLAEACR